jgi:hypothetical protein
MALACLSDLAFKTGYGDWAWSQRCFCRRRRDRFDKFRNVSLWAYFVEYFSHICLRDNPICGIVVDIITPPLKLFFEKFAGLKAC